MPSMERAFIGVAGVAFLFGLTACASPDIDRTGPRFDDSQYARDLNTCRGGNAVTFAASGLAGAVLGSMWGAAEGATNGAIAGDAKEGAAIGAIVGGILGLGVGAFAALEERGDSVESCLRGKGYAPSPV